MNCPGESERFLCLGTPLAIEPEFAFPYCRSAILACGCLYLPFGSCNTGTILAHVFHWWPVFRRFRCSATVDQELDQADAPPSILFQQIAHSIREDVYVT